MFISANTHQCFTPFFVADCSKLQILRKYERYETTYDYKHELNARTPIQTHPISLIERTEYWSCIDDARFSFHSPEKTDFVPMFPLCHWMWYICFVLFLSNFFSSYFTFVFFIADAELSYIWNNLYRPRLGACVCECAGLIWPSNNIHLPARFFFSLLFIEANTRNKLPTHSYTYGPFVYASHSIQTENILLFWP